MNALAQYVLDHTIRGECRCQKCIDRGYSPDPDGHTADVVFFKAAAINNPTAEEFIQMTMDNKGHWTDMNPLDGEEHGYMELGGWVVNQNIALQYMALGQILGVFQIHEPKSMFPGIDEEEAMRMAGAGLITITANSMAHILEGSSAH
jgi:hypothetical protein